MKVALLIHAHTNPEQLARLVSRLRHPHVDIFINVDGKVNIQLFKNVIENVYFLDDRVEVVWGRFSQLQQILNSFNEIADTKVPYSHILFISGLDYPIVPMSEIVEFLYNNPNKSYIDYFKLGDDDWSNLMRKRFEYWFFLPENDIRNNHIIKKILKKVGFKRKYPFPEVYYGSCWFTLSMEAVNYLLDYTGKNPNILDFFKHTGCSDELYIQSVLLNSPLKKDMVKEIYRFFDWGDKGKSPKILTSEDFPQIEVSKAWFARKLDINIDSQLMDMLDKLNAEKQ
ncbi:core-2/I-Branching enzyme [Dysgonomonas alginatilytica]|uniref:Peptide O-xylosyltransferase n=1 Tax=Dysgonomonas alginatilytica TaxID=1605892 RepID=A0A2V3PLS4_9BACT|nr:beta-1,6-N-acetylglucosaminyltransferase [Dysgonomonas alginatilytica]PXV60964.1 core-2/I-Branching enzyme [Dysgonomonas alginatilytica]